MARSIRIDTETAKYYLNLETYFLLLAQKIGIDLDSYLEEQQSIVRAIDPSKRAEYRQQLFERWQEAVGKREFKPTTRNRRVVSGGTRSSNGSKTRPSPPPNF